MLFKKLKLSLIKGVRDELKQYLIAENSGLVRIINFFTKLMETFW